MASATASRASWSTRSTTEPMNPRLLRSAESGFRRSWATSASNSGISSDAGRSSNRFLPQLPGFSAKPGRALRQSDRLFSATACDQVIDHFHEAALPIQNLIDFFRRGQGLATGRGSEGGNQTPAVERAQALDQGCRVGDVT